jgi:ABC-type lipoprotein release transport system permease subunit
VSCTGCQHPDRSDTSVLVGAAPPWSDRGVPTSLALARAQLRHGWRNLVGIAVLVALIGGLVLAGLAGAQRTRTAVDRMIEKNEVSDVLINPDLGDESALDFDKVAALPMVAAFSRVHGVAAFGEGPFTADNLFSSLPPLATDGHLLVDFDRPVMVAGRVPDPGSTDEVYVDRNYAASEGLHVGDTIRRTVFPSDVLQAAQSAADPNAGLAVLNAPGAGKLVEATIVGIGNGLDGIVVDEGYEPVQVWMGPAMYEQLGEPSAGYGGAAVRLKDPSQIDEFKAAVQALMPPADPANPDTIVFQTQAVTRAKALRATEPAATALAIFAVIATLLGALLVGQAVSRRFQLDARDNETLAAIGTTSRQRFGTSMIRLAVAVAVGTVSALVLASALSVLTPVGPARNAEPDPGFHFDARILLGGGALLLVVFVAVGVLPAWNNARRRERVGAIRGSVVAGWLATNGASPALSNGVRFGLEPGRGSTAVPTRATIIGAITAITVAAATIVFASSLDRVVHDGRFFGSNFDVIIDREDGPSSDEAAVSGMVGAIAADPDVERVGEMRITEITVDGRPETSLAFGTFGDATAVTPTIAEGRAPTTAGEIALGLTTMRQLDVGVGDTVDVTIDGAASTAEVVGRAVLPGVGLYQGSDRTSIGVGAVIAPEALGLRTEATKGFVLVGLKPGADLDNFETRMGTALSAYGQPQFRTGSRPSDIEGLARLKSLPVVLASLLVLVVGVTVANAMVVAVRRRRRDIAILQSIGSTRGNVTATGVWQGVTVAIVGLLFGVPLGIVFGRWFWTRLANSFGTLAEPVVPLAGVAALVVMVVVLAAIAGFVPIRRGLRHHPAEVLRSE